MIRVVLEMEVEPGREDEFIAAWRKVAAAASRAAGNRSQALARDLDAPNRFVITTDWISDGAFTAWERSAEQHSVTAPLRALRRSVRMTRHELVVSMDGTAEADRPARPAVRSVIVARIAPGAEQRVAELFAESDRTELPQVAGVRHRSLFVKDGLYLHLIEADADIADGVGDLRAHPRFQEISRALEPYIQPYDPETWRSPADAFAREFYSYDRDAAKVSRVEEG